MVRDNGIGIDGKDRDRIFDGLNESWAARRRAALGLAYGSYATWWNQWAVR